ncbi:hypothetical protein [Planctomicrobium sp. SH527]|uniref:hypothetical protein n=1 Tax=Planctomicrobium sp. SH527 TaxID=3448123 RepID=UPI003F5C87DC
MLTPQLYLRLCLLQGACLALGLGVPLGLSGQFFNSGIVGVAQFLMIYTGVLAILTAGTGLLFLKELRMSLSDAIKATRDPDLEEMSKPAPQAGFVIFRGEDESPVSAESVPAWKANWRRSTHVADGQTLPSQIQKA